MDLVVLFGIAVALLVVLLTLLFVSKRKNGSAGAEQNEQDANVPRRAQVVRNQRNRARVAAAAVEEEAENDSDQDVIPRATQDLNAEKMGAKKRAKLEAKAEKKAQREVELKLRDEQKKKDALEEEERKRQEEREAAEERKREELEKKKQEEREKREYEEYLKMKEAFSVEEEGYDQEEENEKGNMLQEFLRFIKENKVVVLEDLAVQFRLKTQAVIDRIVELQKDGQLSGVIDDRGKFIYISEEELHSVAKFIKQRGRVSITELAENSNSLINLTPLTVVVE
ncbi:DDRGK domain-containing protein 1 [Toxorhynchites rutilus septentrionalis]|uniref:DDRGK domain-containing protein 1 n=1 Tax=Toxorhynchites rutilus septentrionalis TaxID=329112 RepID=UPI00247908D6|nr:DDRGK domain-containing protein 1 [Toxorhynchites rutilus septentrionalis]